MRACVTVIGYQEVLLKEFYRCSPLVKQLLSFLTFCVDFNGFSKDLKLIFF